MPSSSPNNNRRHRRRNYTSVANQDIDDEDGTNCDDFHDEPVAATASAPASSGNAKPASSRATPKDKNDGAESEDEDISEDLPMSLIILDSAQNKFPIPCDKNWTVGKFKRRSAKIHKVAPAQQRLIFRGKMLTVDDQTLAENKLDTDDLIVHLFPKPRVVVTAKGTAGKKDPNDAGRNRPDGADEDGDTGIVDEDHHGAHIPSIVIDEEEQERRGQILVLGSVEIAESQNNVKLLSVLLVMICSMRLLALASIALGAVEDPEYENGGMNPDAIHNHTGEVPNNGIYDADFTDDNFDPNYHIRNWQTQDYFDLLVSGIGFYVGTLGLKATQENTSKLATAYAIGTIIAGIGWNLWNVWDYYKFFEVNTHGKLEPSHNSSGPDYQDGGSDAELTRDDYITVAFFTILMPLFVWFLCWVRAFEFRRLIREAEEEAAERIRGEYSITEGINEDAEAVPITSGTNPEIV